MGKNESQHLHREQPSIWPKPAPPLQADQAIEPNNKYAKESTFVLPLFALFLLPHSSA
ncbi:MAG: hypothetical protein HFH62_01600 [Lachnospiraceae bacterium]|nr:hypothetical protein [Lachnospiraceae bacterium]